LLKLLFIIVLKHNSDMSMTSIAGTRETLFVLVSKKRHFFKIQFLYFWFILLSQIFCTPSKLTKHTGY